MWGAGGGGGGGWDSVGGCKNAWARRGEYKGTLGQHVRCSHQFKINL